MSDENETGDIESGARASGKSGHESGDVESGDRESQSGSESDSTQDVLPIGRQPVVRVAFSSDSGMTFPISVRVDDGDPLGRAAVVMLPSGDALVAWLESVPEGQAEIRARRVFADGTFDDSFLVSATSPERASGFPQVVRVENHVYFAWTEIGEPSKVRMAQLELPRSWR